MNGENERFVIEEGPEWSPVKWAFDIWTWILIIIAIIVFEVFADPLLSGLVVCFKFAWADGWAGQRATKDGQPRRGAMLSSLYSGRACLKIAMAGAAVAIAIAVGRNLRPERLIAGLLVTYCAFFFATLFIYGAAAAINRGYWRPWIDKPYYSQLPPRKFCSRNRVSYTLLGGVLATSVSLLPLAAAYFDARGLRPGFGIGFSIALFLLWGWIVFQMLRSLQRLAAVPEECWPELVGPSASGPMSDERR